MLRITALSLVLWLAVELLDIARLPRWAAWSVTAVVLGSIALAGERAMRWIAGAPPRGAAWRLQRQPGRDLDRDHRERGES